jgi:hypothetical protein
MTIMDYILALRCHFAALVENLRRYHLESLPLVDQSNWTVSWGTDYTSLVWCEGY